MVDAAAPEAKDQDQTKVGQFAVTNVAELLERSAYYGFTSILGLYLTELGYGGAAVGAIVIILLAVPYVLPLLSAPLAEKLAYKRVMVVALACYAAGFAVLASSDSIQAILVGVSLVAVGAGGFKPVATATIAHVTALRHRSLGFTVYYTGINIGGFAGPFLVATLTDSLAAGFIVAGAIMVGALLLTLLAYRSPQPPQDVSVAKALGKLGAIFEDMRLVVLLLVFSGFWFLYSMNFSFLVLYLDRFVALPGWFEPSLQQSYNPLIVMFLAIPIGAFATKRDPRAMMTVGVLLYVIGFTLVGFVQHIAAFFVGLFVATVGEILAYPAFLTYIAGIAPKDRIAVYQSYGFLPLFIGFFFGPLATGPFYDSIAVDAGRPELFWAIPISVGVLALVGFLVLAARDTEGAQRRSGFTRAGLVLLLVPALFAGAVLAGTQASNAAEPLDPLAAGTVLARQEGTLAVGESATFDVTIPDNANNVTFQLRWTDEPPATQVPGATNQPDTFRLKVDAAGGGEGFAPNGAGAEGVLRVEGSGVPPGIARITVTLQSSGGTVFLGQEVAADGSNDWTFEAVTR